MKKPKKPVRWQKECMSSYNLNCKDWSVVSESESYLKIINKKSGKLKFLDKYRRKSYAI